MNLGVIGFLGALAIGLAAGDTAAAKAAKGPPGDGLAAAFGNTVKARYPDGRVQYYWFKPDGRWDAIGRRGKPSSGKWTAKGDKVCLKQTRPFAAPMKYCTDFPAKGGPGTSWSGKSAGGEPIRLSVVRGIVRP